jgi:hypothetical protein
MSVLNLDFENLIRKEIKEYKINQLLEDIHLTYSEHITKIRSHIRNIYKSTFKEQYHKLFHCKDDENQFIESHFCLAYLKEQQVYYKNVITNIVRLDSIPKVEQRTPEWYEQRHNVISASSISKVLGSGKKDILLEKIGIERPFLTNDAIVNGIVFEIVSQTLYETRNALTISEYGCIPHDKHNFIGASPDGVVHDLDYIDMYNTDFSKLVTIHPNLTVDMISLFGRLLEIKNPTSRELKNKIKSDYQKQITTQQEVCKLYMCDYLENKYNLYNDLDEFLEDCFCFDSVSDLTPPEIDNYVKNHNIPLDNINKEGNEKGVIIQFGNGEAYTSSLFDMKTLYTKNTINEWITSETTKFAELGFTDTKVMYWSVKDYNLIVSSFNENEWNSLLNASRELWATILEERLMSDKEVCDKYNNLEVIDNNIELSSSKNTSTEFKKRNLKRKRKERNNVSQFSF